MLIQFKFSNYRCFADETEFNIAAAPIREHKNSLIDVNNVQLLPVAALYGANAAGKSSFFNAFNCMRNAVVKNVFETMSDMKPKTSIITTPFLFTGDPKNIDEALSKPTSFEVIFSINKYAYRYGFICTQKSIISEWLYKQLISKNETTERLIYESVKGKNIKIGKVNRSLFNEISYCDSMKSDNTLMLSDFGKRNKNEELTSIFMFFFRCDILLNNMLEGMSEFGYVQLAGGIFDNNSELLKVEGYPSMKNAQIKLVHRIKSLIKEIDPSIFDIVPKYELDENGEKQYKLFSYHKVNGSSYSVPFDLESDGTKKYLFLCIVICTSLVTGTPLFIDELDAKLHPLLLRKIVRMYKDKSLNHKGAQLIFSAHNIINLDSSDLRRDEVWFIEKKDQKSTMYSLYDFDDDEKVRSDLDFGKHYLAGRFGAIPFQDEGSDQ